jgi:hypothetical protein
MTQIPRVAIILVNWNGRQVTLDCLTSLRAVSYPNVLTIVVDNNSQDGSVEAIQSAFPEVLILSLPRNLRFAGGNNAGMRKALEQGADLVLLLNNDTLIDAECVTALVERMHTDHSCGMVAPKIYYADDPQRIWFAGGAISFWSGTMRHIGIREIDAGQYDTSRSIDYASGCCMLTRREVIEGVGMLDESYFMYTEDADWCMRVRLAGYSIVYEPRAKVWHRLSISSGGHLSWFKMKNKALSNMRFFGRYASWYHWFTFPWLNVLVNAFSTLQYLMRARS